MMTRIPTGHADIISAWGIGDLHDIGVRPEPAREPPPAPLVDEPTDRVGHGCTAVLV
jgi:hypothetical protein